MILTKRILYYGTDQLPPERIPLRAGPLQLFFENGDLRHIRFGSREVLRRVYVAVRDRNWGTVLPVLSNLKILQGETCFQIRFEACCLQEEIDFRWLGEVTGDEDGAIHFAMNGTAYGEFWRNRIGFCVLHPISECAGQPCQVLHRDGEVEETSFPEYIAPHQPFKDIRAIRHEVIPGTFAEVRLEGDTFETEDQRNWTDASFKTYCTPLAQPFPVLVKMGDLIQQEIEIKLNGKGGKSVKRKKARPISDNLATAITFDPSAPDPFPPLPALGFCLTPHGENLTNREIARLQASNLSHLRLDLNFSKPVWLDNLCRGVEVSNALDIPLEIALYLTHEAEDALSALRAAVSPMQARIARWLVFHIHEDSTELKWVDLARKILDEYDSSIPIGCGADSNFTELNRWHTALPSRSFHYPSPDFLVYAANPQVHAFDNLSMVENLAGLGETVRNARRIAGGKPVVISPVTLKPRFKAAVITPQEKEDPTAALTTVDSRQVSLFGAAWTLGAIKYLSEGGAAAVTFYETTGWRGVMELESGSPLPALFPSIPGAVFPMYHVFANVGEFAGGQVLPSRSSNPLKVESLVLKKGRQVRVMVTSLENQSCQVEVHSLPQKVSLKILDEYNAQEAMEKPKTYREHPGERQETDNGVLKLCLTPYAQACIDYQGDGT